MMDPNDSLYIFATNEKTTNIPYQNEETRPFIPSRPTDDRL